jgi:hypothetical protein
MNSYLEERDLGRGGQRYVAEVGGGGDGAPIVMIDLMQDRCSWRPTSHERRSRCHLLSTQSHVRPHPPITTLPYSL